jgi:uncharacterized membrane protein
MKIPFIGFICIIFLFANCGRKAFLVKKRYSKGFYSAHAGKIKKQTLAFSTTEPKETSPEKIAVGKQESETPLHCLNDDRAVESVNAAFKPLKLMIPAHRHSKIISAGNSKQFRKIHPNEVDLQRDAVAYIALAVIIALVVGLTKIFGLLFTVTVCLVITFIAVAIFFLVRAHLN